MSPLFILPRIAMVVRTGKRTDSPWEQTGEVALTPAKREAFPNQIGNQQSLARRTASESDYVAQAE